VDTDLLFAAAVVAVLGTAALLRPLGLRGATFCALLKVSLCAGYFAWFDDGGWRLVDDVTYAREGGDLLAEGLGPVQLFLAPSQVALVMSLLGSRNIGYYVFNAGAQGLFGNHYWAAVMLNVLATCLAGAGVARIAALADLPRARRRWLVGFFVLHWDVLVWSSLLNLKDSLVLTLTVWSFALGITFLRNPRWRGLCGLAAVILLVSFVRWYVTLLFAAAFVGWGLVALRGGRRLALVFLGLLALVPLSTQTPDLSLLDFGGLAQSGLAFLVTPRPWGIRPDYEFLRIPALLHWATLPLLPLGAWRMWRTHRYLQPLVLYAGLTVAFYSTVPWLVGPRHRLQLAFVLAWMQFAACAWLLEQVLAGRRVAERPLRPEVASP